MATFIPNNGGLGVRLSCTGTSSRTAIPSPTTGDTYRILNMGSDYVSLAFAGSTVLATTSYISFQPGESFLGIPNAGGSGAPTWVAGITTGSTVAVQISLGTLRG